MKITDKRIIEFLDQLASSEPTPGGGAAAAHSAAMSAALGEMVINILNKKKSDRSLEPPLSELGEFRIENIQLIDEDASNFLELLKAYQLKNTTENEKEIKEKSLALSSLKAANTPLNVLGTSVLILEVLEQILPYVSSSLITDIGVSAQLARASINSSYMNILINKNGIKDQDFLKTIENTLPYLVQTGNKKADQLTEIVIEKIN